MKASSGTEPNHFRRSESRDIVNPQISNLPGPTESCPQPRTASPYHVKKYLPGNLTRADCQHEGIRQKDCNPLFGRFEEIAFHQRQGISFQEKVDGKLEFTATKIELVN